MSKMAELSYNIEQLYIAGFNARSIAVELECPIDVVYGWIESNFVAENPQEEMNPDYSFNS